MKYHLLFIGLGAGNIGDEAMFQGFLSLFPLPDGTSVEVWDNTAPVLNLFPQQYKYINFQDKGACEELCLKADSALIVGSTPVMEKWGLNWPLRVLSPKLDFCNRNDIPCNAVGVGVDFLEIEESKRLFKKSFLHINSWTVRSARSRNNLISLGVEPKRIKTTADFAWLMPRNSINKEWAGIFLSELGVKKNEPIIGVNIVNEMWKDNVIIKKELAVALDRIIEAFGWQVVFFCNETRDGGYYDFEASRQTSSLMKNKAFIVPNKYFSPQEMLSLIFFCRITISWRYHFTILSCLAGAVPISVIRGEKIQELVEDIGAEHIGIPEDICYNEIIEKVKYVSENINAMKVQQKATIEIMRMRSKLNLTFVDPVHFDER